MPNPAQAKEQLDAIREKHSGARWTEAALAEAAQVWGGGTNEHAVFSGEKEVIAKAKSTEAAVTIVETPSGLFTFGVSFQTYDYGFTSPATVWSPPCATREEAMKAAVAEILAGMDRSKSTRKQAREDARRIREQLEAMLKPKQRLLFE